MKKRKTRETKPLRKDCKIDETRMLFIYKRIGQNVKHARNERGVSQLALSLAMGNKAVGSVSLAELCIQNKHFNIEHLIKISCILDVALIKLFDGVFDEPPAA
ncbi:hypothetical protein FACS1894103_1800 [Campylobacterota bacterium]|nr:hypothetical protein FACS1894103_1800 [Campylobacterota bacterium]